MVYVVELCDRELCCQVLIVGPILSHTSFKPIGKLAACRKEGVWVSIQGRALAGALPLFGATTLVGTLIRRPNDCVHH